MSKQSTFYIEGVKVAMDLLGFTKTALGVPGAIIGGQALKGVARGALTGAAMGGIGGFAGAPEGEGGKGFLRGMGYGALAGGVTGGVTRGLHARKFVNAPENQAMLQRTERMMNRATDPEAQARISRGAHNIVGRGAGGIYSQGMAGLGAGALAGMSTPKPGILERAREELGI